jgi:hypothetical protein
MTKKEKWLEWFRAQVKPKNIKVTPKFERILLTGRRCDIFMGPRYISNLMASGFVPEEDIFDNDKAASDTEINILTYVLPRVHNKDELKYAKDHCDILHEGVIERYFPEHYTDEYKYGWPYTTLFRIHWPYSEWIMTAIFRNFPDYLAYLRYIIDEALKQIRPEYLRIFEMVHKYPELAYDKIDECLDNPSGLTQKIMESSDVKHFDDFIEKAISKKYAEFAENPVWVYKNCPDSPTVKLLKDICDGNDEKAMILLKSEDIGKAIIGTTNLYDVILENSSIKNIFREIIEDHLKT